MLLLLDIQITRINCYEVIWPYIFCMCFQAVMMLMILFDIFIMIYLPIWYRNTGTRKYVGMMLILPVAYGALVMIWGFILMDDEIVVFCNPPIGLHPIVSRFWSLSNVFLNTLVLIAFIALMFVIYHKGRKSRDAKKIVRHLKVTMTAFVFSWYTCLFGVDIWVTLGSFSLYYAIPNRILYSCGGRRNIVKPSLRSGAASNGFAD
ncbi:unnamed protein product [Caenorhabditis auriculariae]|uniref:G-protein coupled receptors family 1 profile domain-containing protein n=1 Tax=Caenorhabditis auriculariae TaxID=2777116 RepID=A0A8S1HS27_9PELO|nr:unnamed protein product [Caenorhabditis auriculariae]